MTTQKQKNVAERLIERIGTHADEFDYYHINFTHKPTGIFFFIHERGGISIVLRKDYNLAKDDNRVQLTKKQTTMFIEAEKRWKSIINKRCRTAAKKRIDAQLREKGV